MKSKKFFLFNALFAILIASAIFFVSQKGFFNRLELASLDLFFNLKKATHANPKIIIVEITDADVASIGNWPWQRSWHAAMARALTSLGAKFVYFDFILAEASSPEGDVLFERELQSNKNIYLPFAFTTIPYDYKKAILPYKNFLDNAGGIGAINILPDGDGAIRRIPLIFLANGKIYPHIAFKLAADYLGMHIKNVTVDSLILSNGIQNLNIPILPKETMLLNWMGKWGTTFKHYSFLDVLAAYKDVQDKIQPKININDFKNSLCIVAVGAVGLVDIKAMPLEPVYPGVGVLATTISNIIDKKFFFYPPLWVNMLILYILSLVPLFIVQGERPLRETIQLFSIIGIYFAVNFILFQNRIIINFSYPLVGLVTNYLFFGTYNFLRVSMEKQTFFKMSVTDGLTGLFNISYFKILLETEIILTKSNPNNTFCILMADVDHFKNFNDTYGHQTGDIVLKETANVIKNSVRSTDVVARYGGEEMIVLLRGASLRFGLSVAEKIRRAIENNPVRIHETVHHVEMSLGVAVFKSKDDIDTVIKRADEGLYMAKKTGRNRVSTMEDAS
ncbi:MAG: diguanylate cyclase [Candidatus Omnitrophica bacterium]|nr:diguanylate cyclase [Candidatus Omnitrophota bacterium]